MNQAPDVLIVGLVFLTGWAAHVIGSRTHVPRVTLLLAIGIIAGPAVLDLVPEGLAQHFTTVSHLALAMVGFLLGESFAGRDFAKEKREILYLSLGASIAPALVVTLAVWGLTGDIALSLLLGGIATATDPAATYDVIRESRAHGSVSRMLKSVVAVDDAWGVILFSLMLILASSISGNGNGVGDLAHGAWEIFGAIAIGFLLGIPMSMAIGRYRLGEPTIVEAMGFVFICGGLAHALGVSYLLACMVLGATVARRAKHISRPFHAIERSSEPFLIVFFLLSGVNLDPSALKLLGTVALVYLVARSVGKVLGAQLFGHLIQTPPAVSRHLGWCLLPQAGVAVGMALLVQERFPEYGSSVLALTIATTVIFELLGPVVARHHLSQAGEIGPSNSRIGKG